MRGRSCTAAPSPRKTLSGTSTRPAAAHHSRLELGQSIAWLQAGDGQPYAPHYPPATFPCPRYSVRMAVVDLDAPPSWWSCKANDNLTAEDARALAGTKGGSTTQRQRGRPGSVLLSSRFTSAMLRAEVACWEAPRWLHFEAGHWKALQPVLRLLS